MYIKIDIGIDMYIWRFTRATPARGSKCETTAYRRCACIDIHTDIRFSIYRCTYIYTYTCTRIPYMDVCIYIYTFLFGATSARCSKCKTTAYGRCLYIDIHTSIHLYVYKNRHWHRYVYLKIHQSDSCARLEVWNNCIRKVRVYDVHEDILL